MSREPSKSCSTRVELHRQPALADLHQADALRLLLALLLLQPRDDVVARGAAHDLQLGIGGGTLARGELRHGRVTVPSARPSAVCTIDRVAWLNADIAARGDRVGRSADGCLGIERKLRKQKRIGAADRRELDADERAVRPGTHVGLDISGDDPGARCGATSFTRQPLTSRR